MSVVHITSGSGKMLGISSINTPTTKNPFCDKMRQVENSVCSKCYAAQYESFRPTLVTALHRNMFLTEREITQRETPVINAQIFRFDSYGELHNRVHFENLIRICEYNPETIFTLWTKRKDVVHSVLKQRDKPTNLILIYSSAYLDKSVRVPKNFDKVFTVHSKNSTTDINCHGSCNTCRLCYSHNSVRYINEIVK